MTRLKKIELPSTSIPWILSVLLAVGNVGLIFHNLMLRRALRAYTTPNILAEKQKVSSFTAHQLEAIRELF